MIVQVYRIILVFTVLTAFSCDRYKYPDPGTENLQGELLEGQKVYMNYCQKCHPDGESGLGPTVLRLPDFARKFQVRHGLGVMPDFEENVISDKELEQITLYLDYLDEKAD